MCQHNGAASNGYLVLLVLLGQGGKVAGNRHDNGGGLGRWQEGEEPGDEALSLPYRHDHHTLLITNSLRGRQKELVEMDMLLCHMQRGDQQSGTRTNIEEG